MSLVICPFCGNSLRTSAKFCSFCGHPLPLTPTASDVAPKGFAPYSPSKAWFRSHRLLLFVILTGILLGSGWLAWMKLAQGRISQTSPIIIARPTLPPPQIRATAVQPTTSPQTALSLADPGTLRVHFIDVGQGDSTLIQVPDGTTALIDGGYDNGLALQYLRTLGITHIDVMIASHPHADHIGGLVEILRAMPVGVVWTSGASHSTGIYEQFLDAIAEAKVPYREAQRGDTIPFGALTFTVLHSERDADNLNDTSLVLHLTYGQISYLFTGDAEDPSEKAMLREESNLLAATILKVGHHGSHTSSSPAFLAAVKPQVVVYSAGRHNSYGHPHASTITNLCRANALIYGTAQHGTVVISTTQDHYTVRTTTQAPAQACAQPQTPIATRTPQR